ncbi:DNA binding protein [Tribonema minus]|uniref:DNA binding protein n=1 Tax=Tribonema minus TaxID=303371 RepID=A0A835Z1U0_9STRA|nr:DNA binding protein [Tribonema minus]
MSSSGPSKINATKDQVIGQVKATVGKTIGNHQMEAEGNVQHQHGTTEKEVAAAKQKGEGLVDNVHGHLQKATGQFTGNERMQAEGEVNKAKGKAKQDTA